MTTIDVETTPDGIVLRHAEQGEVAVATPSLQADAADSYGSVEGYRCPRSLQTRQPGEFLSAVMGEPVELVYLDDPRHRPVRPEFSQPGDHVSFADAYPLLITTTASLENLNGRLPFEGWK